MWTSGRLNKKAYCWFFKITRLVELRVSLTKFRVKGFIWTEHSRSKGSDDETQPRFWSRHNHRIKGFSVAV